MITQNNILEGFSVGLPVVPTKITFDSIVNFVGDNQYFLCAEKFQEWIDSGQTVKFKQPE
jgi:hypothetical protein